MKQHWQENNESEVAVASWHWELTDADRSSSSGNLAKLFKNETVKSPGVFATNAPSEHATLMAREVIQNSADAATELASDLDYDPPEFKINFDFESLTGGAKAHMVRALDLGSIAARGTDHSEPGWRSRLGLDDDDALDHLDDDSPLKILRIVESGTAGMHGPFIGASSKMYLALISLGFTEKGKGSGGSYGYGKAGLIRGSAIRTVVAYSAFREREDDPGVTRRLLGVTYWGQHQIDGLSYTGFARFGDAVTATSIRPFENEAADSAARQLGIEVRTPGEPAELGTTFLLIEPTVTANDLTEAVARNWWPALEDGRMTVTISEGGTELIPRAMKDPLLRNFVDAYHLATTDQDNPKPNQVRHTFKRAVIGDRQMELGGLGLVAEPGGWSYEGDPQDGVGDTAQRSLIALVRGPRMVVEYYDAGRSRPFIRGVFVADDEVDDLLRQTEPKAHDSWQTRSDELGSDPIAAEAAGIILRRIRDNVRRFREKLRPAARPAEDVRLPELERLFGRMFGGPAARPGPLQVDRPFTIAVNQQIEPVSDRAIRLTGNVSFGLADHFTGDHADVELIVSYRFVEEGGNGEEAELVIDCPEGFTEMGDRPYRYVGRLSATRLTIPFKSVPYPSDWTGRLKGDVVFTTLEEPAT